MKSYYNEILLYIAFLKDTRFFKIIQKFLEYLINDI